MLKNTQVGEIQFELTDFVLPRVLILLYIYSNCTFKLRKCQWEWDRNDIFSQNLFRRPTPTSDIFVEIGINFSFFLRPPTSLPVEFGESNFSLLGPAKGIT